VQIPCSAVLHHTVAPLIWGARLERSIKDLREAHSCPDQAKTVVPRSVNRLVTGSIVSLSLGVCPSARRVWLRLKRSRGSKGEPIDGTARSVDESDLDGQGYYPRKLDFTVPELDVRKLVAFQLGGVLAKQDIDHFIAAGFLKVDGVNLIFTARGEAALLQHLPL
jgi:hypothetical protein